MILTYVKGAVAGLIAMLLGCIGYVVVMIWRVSNQTTEYAEVGIDLVALAMNPTFLAIALASFACGFFWQFRRLSL